MVLEHYQPNIKIFLGGTEFVFWNTANISTRLNSLSDITITVPNNRGEFSHRFPNGTEIKVYASYDQNQDVLFWQGEVEKYTIPKDKKSSMINLWGRDKGKIMYDERTVDSVFNSYSQFTGKYWQLIQFMNTQLSVPLTTSIEPADTDLLVVKTFGFDKTVDEVIDACKKGGYEWFYESRTETFVVRPPRELVDANVVKSYVLGNLAEFNDTELTDVVQLISNKITVDSSDKITWVRFDGIEGVKGIWPISQPTIIKEYHEQSDEWTTAQDAQQAARNYYNAHFADRTSLDIELPFGDEVLLLGDIIRCDDALYGLSTVNSKLYRIIEINHVFQKKGGWKTTLALGDFSPSLSDFL